MSMTLERADATEVKDRGAPRRPGRVASRPRARRRWMSIATTVLFVFAAAAWFVSFRPSFLGGPTHYVIVSGTSMVPTFEDRDLVVVRSHHEYRVGDVIAYRIPAGEPGAGLQVIHRIIGGDAALGYVTQGDNRSSPDQWRPTPHDILGSRSVHVPWIGHAMAWARTPLVLGAFAGLFVVWCLWGGQRSRPAQKRSGRRRQSEAAPESPHAV